MLNQVVLLFCQTRSRYEAQELIPPAEVMMAKLKEYFHAAIKKPVYLCLTLLDPRLKTSQLTLDVLALVGLTLDEVLARFTDEASKFFVTDTCEAAKQHEEIQSETRSRRVIYKQKKRKIASLDEEIEAYLSGKCEIKSCNTLLYWKVNAKRFPSLANMARTFLAVPALSAPCERAFSVGQHIQSYTRNRMSLKTLESLIFLKDWVKHDIIDVNDVHI